MGFRGWFRRFTLLRSRVIATFAAFLIDYLRLNSPTTNMSGIPCKLPRLAPGPQRGLSAAGFAELGRRLLAAHAPLLFRPIGDILRGVPSGRMQVAGNGDQGLPQGA